MSWKNPTSSNIALQWHCIVSNLKISFEVYITFVFIVMFASLVVLSKICIYDWWMKEKVRYKDFLSHILWMWLSGTGGWYIYTSCAGNIQQHSIHWNGLHPKWFHWVSFSVEKNWWWVIINSLINKMIFSTRSKEILNGQLWAMGSLTVDIPISSR